MEITKAYTIESCISEEKTNRQKKKRGKPARTNSYRTDTNSLWKLTNFIFVRKMDAAVGMGQKTLYLHVGMHKTATTSIQNVCMDNLEVLKKNGIYYANKFSYGVSCHNMEMYSFFCDAPEKYYANVRSGFTKKEIEKKYSKQKQLLIEEIRSTDCDRVIISAEDLSHLPKHSIQAMKDFFSSLDCDIKIKIIFTTRDAISFIASAFQEDVKRGHECQFLKPPIQKIDLYRYKLEKFIDVFGKENIIIYKYEDSLRHPNGPVGSFLDKLDFDYRLLANIQKENSNLGVSHKAIEIMHYINQIEPSFLDGKMNPRRKNNDLTPFWAIKGEKFKFDKLTLGKIVTACKEDVEWLNGLKLGVTYNVEYDRQNEAGKIAYDSQYKRDLINVLAQISNEMIRMVYDFCCKKTQELNDAESLVTMQDIVLFIENNFELRAQSPIS